MSVDIWGALDSAEKVGEIFSVGRRRLSAVSPEQRREEQFQAAFSSFNAALRETVSYMQMLEKGVPYDLSKENQLSELWCKAADAMNPFDADLANRCMIKGNGWLDPKVWQDPAFKDKINVQQMRNDFTKWNSSQGRFQQQSAPSWSPMGILREAIRAVPAVKYALGIAGVAAAIAIIKGFKLDFRVAIFGTIIMLILMMLLVIFAKATKTNAKAIAIPALVFTWFALLITMATALLLLTSAFWKWPLDLQWLPHKNISAPSPEPINQASQGEKQVNSREPAALYPAAHYKPPPTAPVMVATPPCMQIDASGKCISCSFNVTQRNMAGCAGGGGPADYSQVYSCQKMPEGVAVQATLIADWTTATPTNRRWIDIALDEVGGEGCPGLNQPCWNRIIDSNPPTNPRMVVVSKTRNGASSWLIRNSHCVVNGNTFCDKCSTVGEATLTITSIGK